MTKAIFIIAQKGFRDEELFTTKEVLDTSGIKTQVASISIQTAQGSLGKTIKPDIAIKDIKINTFDAIIVVGGPGSPTLAFCEELMTLLRKAKTDDKIICGICLAPMVLAQAGVLTYKKATVYKTDDSLLAFSDNAVHLVEQDVVEDDYAITANGPKAAQAFGKAIVKKLQHS